MNKKQIIYIVIIAIIVVLIGLITNTIKTDRASSAREEAMEVDRSRPETTINVKHQYKDGEHVFVGMMPLETPCHSHNAVVEDSEKPIIALTTTSPGEDVVCIQFIDEAPFKVTYTSDDIDLEFLGTLNGDPVILNIFEVSAEEDIDLLELFIKG